MRTAEVFGLALGLVLALDFAPGLAVAVVFDLVAALAPGDLVAAFDFVLPGPDLRLGFALVLRTGLAMASCRGVASPAASSNSASASSI